MPIGVLGQTNRAGRGDAFQPRGDVGRVAEHLARRIDDDQPRVQADARSKLWRAVTCVVGVGLRQSALDRERRTHRALGVVFLCLAVAEIGGDFAPSAVRDRAAVSAERLGG